MQRTLRHLTAGTSPANREQDVVGPTRQKSCFGGFQQGGAVDDHKIISVAQLSEQRRKLGIGKDPKPVSVRQSRRQVVHAKIGEVLHGFCKWTVVRQHAEQARALVSGPAGKLPKVKE